MAYGVYRKILSKTKLNTQFDSLTVGRVVDTNDPQGMGRIRVFCAAWDSDDVLLGDIPWAMYNAPFGGISQNTTRGSEDTSSEGKVAYGAWHIPKVGSNVTVICIDKNPNYRVWLGCIFDQFLTHTMPHGRFLDDDATGPVSSKEQPINPLSDNYNKAFANKTYEWKTRIADYSVSSIDNIIVENKRTESTQIDTKGGYTVSRIEPDITINGRTNLDSHIYSWVTPGFHAFSMDDKKENSRMRFRTSTGHQIIMDDTNERIYIMTAEGANWIEMDQNGNIDIYSNRRVSVRSKKDINLTSDETVRIYGGKGVHIVAGAEHGLRMDSAGIFHNKSVGGIVLNTDANFSIKAVNLNVEIGTNFNLSSSSANILGTSQTSIKGGTLNLKGDSSILATGGAIHLNGPAAANPQKAVVEENIASLWTNRVPDAEPWARGVVKDLDSNLNHEPELGVDDANVNKVENGEDLLRNANWRR